MRLYRIEFEGRVPHFRFDAVHLNEKEKKDSFSLRAPIQSKLASFTFRQPGVKFYYLRWRIERFS